MRIISHRGCQEGPNKEIENNPKQISKMINEGFDVEIDVFCDDKTGFYLGHDSPTHRVDIDFLKTPGLWCHAKDPHSLSNMLQNNIHCFWHQQDDFTITSKNYIWAYPGIETSGKNTVMLYPEKYPDIDCFKYYAICTDYPYEFLKKRRQVHEII